MNDLSKHHSDEVISHKEPLLPLETIQYRAAFFLVCGLLLKILNIKVDQWLHITAFPLGSFLSLLAIIMLIISIYIVIHNLCTNYQVKIVVCLAFLLPFSLQLYNLYTEIFTSPKFAIFSYLNQFTNGNAKNLINTLGFLLMIVGFYLALIELYQSRKKLLIANQALKEEIAERERLQERQIRLMEQLQQAHRMEAVGVLAGGMAHDFNNLMQSIQGYVEISAQFSDRNPKVVTFLNDALRCTEQARNLGLQLLALAKGGNAFQNPDYLSPIIRTTVQSIVDDSAITCVFDLLEDEEPLIKINSDQMQIIFSHLTTNALEAMPNGGTLHVRSEISAITEENAFPLSPGHYLHIIFKDSGQGISSENIRKIFDPYYTTKVRSTMKGMGLGLAVCHASIKKHKGIITVESSPGNGATFHLYLPVYHPTGK